MATSWKHSIKTQLKLSLIDGPSGKLVNLGELCMFEDEVKDEIYIMRP